MSAPKETARPAITFIHVAPCRKCGSTDRYESNGKCAPCARAEARRLYSANPEPAKEKSCRWREANPERAREIDRRRHRKKAAARNLHQALCIIGQLTEELNEILNDDKRRDNAE
jgi:hypothetical protein